MKQQIPFADLGRLHEGIKQELQAVYDQVLKSSAFIQGSFVRNFEELFATYTGTRFAAGCANGTDALVLALQAFGVEPGDEVITVSHTFVATVEAIVSVGARPVLVDVRREDALINVNLVERAITAKTKGIIAVHLYGQPVDMDPLLAVAKKHKLFVLEDAAQAHGATYKGHKVGSLGDAAAFSFYPGKNLGALGDAGAVVTNNQQLAEKVRFLADHGRKDKYAHEQFAWNMRLDGLQAGFLSVKLKHLDSWNKRRQEIAAFYNRELNGISGLRILETSADVAHVYHLYVVCVEGREKLMGQLKEKGVSCGVHYPLAVHQQQAWTGKYSEVSLPETEALSRTCLSLPMFGEMRDDEAQIVVDALKSCFA